MAYIRPAIGPQRIHAAFQAQRRILANVVLEDLAVVADLLDRLVGKVGAETELLAHVAAGAQKALDRRLVALEHFIDVLRVDAHLLGLDQRIEHPLGDGEPLIIATAHHRAQRLLGNQLGQDDVIVRILGIDRTDRGQAEASVV